MMKIFSYTNITQADNFRFEITRSPLTRPAFDVHGHEYSELVIIFGGTAIHVTEQGNYPLAAGDVFVINGATKHGYEAMAALDICNIGYDPDDMLSGHANLQTLSGYNALFVVEPLYRSTHAMHNLLRLDVDDLQQVGDLVNLMMHEFEGQQAGYTSMIRAQFIQLVVMLSRWHGAHTDERNPSIGRLAAALTRIETEYDQPLRLDDLASAAHLSPAQFSRVFKETFGISPIQYLIRLRIKHACHLLQRHNIPIADVAAQVGFVDFNYFSRQFKQVMGQSPRAYRKNSR